jgi:D-alanyl-D-alanine dipeptidase
MVVTNPNDLATPLVRLDQLDPTLSIDLKYKTPDNFMKKAVYPANAEAFLAESVADRLVQASKFLQKYNLRLVVWDAYRPMSVQQDLWDALPDPYFIASPKTGSNHNRAAAVDVSLTDAQGTLLTMPTEFDEFSDKSHSYCHSIHQPALTHRLQLQEAMTSAGFIVLRTEWWHFNTPEAGDLPLLDIPFELIV